MIPSTKAAYGTTRINKTEMTVILRLWIRYFPLASPVSQSLCFALKGNLFVVLWRGLRSCHSASAGSEGSFSEPVIGFLAIT